MLKKYAETVNANIYINAVKSLGYEVEIYDKESGYAKFTNGEKRVGLLGNVLSVNDAVGVELAGQKCVSSQVLGSSLGVIIPDFVVINIEKRGKKYKKGKGCKECKRYKGHKEYKEIVKDFYNKHDGQIVVKPNTGSLARGVLVLPDSLESVYRHLEETGKNKSPHFLLERYSSAEREFRVIVVKGEIIDVIERIPASVIGDGESSLKELIDEKDALKEDHMLPMIKPDMQYLSRKGLGMDSVLGEGEFQKLNQVCNMGMGGDVKVFDMSKMHNKWAKIAARVYEVTGLSLVGIDVMSDDLSVDPYSDEVETIINEINSAPMPELQYFARAFDEEKYADPLCTVKEILREFLG